MNRLALFAIIASLGLAGCDDPNTRDRIGTGVAAGAIGAVAASALGANTAWTVAAAGAGAAAGVLYARNRQTNQCAYHTGDGDTVTVGACR